MQNSTISLLLIDDHGLVATGLAYFLSAQGYCVTRCQTLAEAREQLASSQFSVLLLDINLGADNGLALLEHGEIPQETKTILLSGTGEQEWIFRGFELGAFGFISKNVEPDDLIGALAAMLGTTPLEDSGWIWDNNNCQLVEAQHYFPRETILTPKEREVFLQMRDGKLDKQIADMLGLSIHTVRVHLRAIKRKRGHNRRFEQTA